MKHLAAYSLLVLSGKPNPSKESPLKQLDENKKIKSLT